MIDQALKVHGGEGENLASHHGEVVGHWREGVELSWLPVLGLSLSLGGSSRVSQAWRW